MNSLAQFGAFDAMATRCFGFPCAANRFRHQKITGVTLAESDIKRVGSLVALGVAI